jgi:hypothetical protein
MKLFRVPHNSVILNVDTIKDIRMYKSSGAVGNYYLRVSFKDKDEYGHTDYEDFQLKTSDEKAANIIFHNLS